MAIYQFIKHLSIWGLGKMTKEFIDLLAQTTEAFRKADLKRHSTITFDGIETRFEFADKRKQAINKICDALADEIENALELRQDITHLGFDEVFLNYKSSLDSDCIFINCDIWESIEPETKMTQKDIKNNTNDDNNIKEPKIGHSKTFIKYKKGEKR